MERSLAVRIANAKTCAVEGIFERHVATGVRTLTGSASGGRWGPRGIYEVLYLGRPRVSVVVEAYRALVDQTEGMRPEAVAGRRLLRAHIKVDHILDLRDPASLAEIGLAPDDLLGSHGPCQQVGLASHQLRLHGILAPAATGLGETLALFERHLSPEELPTLVGEEVWERLPADPRVPHLVPPSEDTE